MTHAPSSPARTPCLWLIAILLLGFAVLISRLETITSLWADEGWTIAATNANDPIITVRDWVVNDVHPPLFFIGLDGWRLFTGDSVFELRYYSVMLTMIAIAVMYRVGRAVYSVRAGLLAALFYALHDLVKVLTQEVRHYPQQMLMVALAMWMYWRFWQRPTRGRGALFAIAGAALLYTHYWGGFVLLALALHTLATRRDHLRAMAASFIGIGLLFAPWLPVLIHQITLERPGGLPHALENNRAVYATLVYQLVGIPELFWVVLCAAGLIGTFTAAPKSWRAWLPTPASWLPLPIIVLTPALSILLNTAYPTLSFRSLAVIVPALALLAAHGLARFRNPERLALVMFIVLYSLSKISAEPLPRPPWPQVADYLAAHATASDIILLELNTDVDPMAYYLDQELVSAPYALTERARDRQPEAFAAYLDDILAGRDGVWVAQMGWEALKDIRPDLLARGFVMSAPAITYSAQGFVAVPQGGTPYLYSDGRPILLWRLDRVRQGDSLTVYSGTDSGDALALLAGDIAVRADGVTVNLLWSPQGSPSRDYTVSAFLLGEGGAFSNHDSAPLNGLSPTRGWQADGLYYDSHYIDASRLPPGDYRVGVAVYYFTDTTYTAIANLSSMDCSDDPDCRFIIIGTATFD